MLEVSSSLHYQGHFREIAPWSTMLLTPPHIIIVVWLNGFISGSLLQQRPLYKPPTFHLDRIQYCGDTRLWSLCIQNCAKWALFSNLVIICYTSRHLVVTVTDNIAAIVNWWYWKQGRLGASLLLLDWSSLSQVFFIESICDDPDIIAENIRVCWCSLPRSIHPRFVVLSVWYGHSSVI